MDAALGPIFERFIVSAKCATYAGGGAKLLPYRLGSHDLQFREGDWAYHDSYFGGSNFSGQEVVYYRDEPVWSMNYFGYLLRPDLLSSAGAGQMIMASLTALYDENRFLGGFEHVRGDLRYLDENEGDFRAFQGKETITQGDTLVYYLLYHGGEIIP
ncbi:MAG TPA: DUF5680 domain-containing protein [Aggregatilinea sp.]|uniref:DUF5680 domain-containing protein n=1 Tax=Aggregatilinea sp. TaxID=2806333 RepID=UPI002C609D21|nr:DUF5680 domain-containing protein [Aggregatilinea sp.]HML21083.1 DUF5680 domain-containing protein [Aggregatilinea sp.]